VTSILIKKEAGGLRVFSLVRAGLRGKNFKNHCCKGLRIILNKSSK
jgi:hypothetical protein